MELWDYEKRKETRRDVDFKKSNKVWNKYRLNKRDNIGHTMSLIKDCKPKNMKEWQDYYEKSGEEAHNLKHKVKFSSFAELREYVHLVNSTHGKTKEDLTELAKEFQDCLTAEGMNLDLETCFNYVYIRAVDETYLGYQREQAAFKGLNNFCEKEGLILKETDERNDVRFGVDYEVYKNKKLIAGIQVKGTVYRDAVQQKSEYTAIEESDKILHDVNNQYSREKKVPVLYAYVTKQFTLECDDVFNELINLRDNKDSLDEKLEGKKCVNSSTVSEKPINIDR